MENYEELIQQRHEVKARMDELGQTEKVLKRIDDWAGNFKSQSQEVLEDRLRFYKETSCRGGNGFTLREDLTDEDLRNRVVESSVIKILKKEITIRQKSIRKDRLIKRHYG